MEDDKNLDRKLDLSSKFILMAEALVSEGKDKNDYSIIQCGNLMMMLSGLVLDEKDMYDFANLCSMFSSKKILENMEQNQLGFSSYMKDKIGSESYIDFINRINNLRNNGKKED